MPEKDIKPGVYRHFKGGMYDVICVAEEVDTHARFVVYRPRYDKTKIVLRSIDDFWSVVEVDGKKVFRFSFMVDFTHEEREELGQTFPIVRAKVSFGEVEEETEVPRHQSENDRREENDEPGFPHHMCIDYIKD